MNLGVKSTTMNELKNSNKDVKSKKRECLQAYFDTGEACWEKVVRAIINYPINNKRLAKEIVGKYELNKDLLE